MLISSVHARLLKRFSFLLLIYSLLRVGFYFYHLGIYRQFTQEEIFTSLLIGVRFDIAALCLLNLPIILLTLIPSENPKFFKFERVFFVVLNLLGILASLDDYELFLFMGKRLSFDLFVIGGDILNQLPQIIHYYWYFPLGALLLGLSLWWVDGCYLKITHARRGPVYSFVSGIIFLALSFIGIRGGLQSKSINVQSAFVQGRNELGHLVLNTPYHFLRTLKSKSVSKMDFFKKDEDAIDVIINRRDLRGNNQGEKKNIVLIILESFSLEYVEKGYTPFFADLMKNSISYPYHLANGRRSIEVLPSVLCGLPSLIGEPISKSTFQGNKFVCMPQLLKNAGYSTAFFHGGSKGTMGFESYTLSNGFQRYFSRDDYPSQADYDGTWGIYDEPFLQFSIQEINKLKPPFLAGLFTLSSHQPYSVPAKYHGQFPKGSLEIHESIGYTDFALKQFFESAKKQSWFNDTIFILTADHTSKLETKKYLNSIGQYRVPLVIFDPQKKLVLQTERVTHHSDIPKTVTDLVGVNGETLPATSVSLFSTDSGYAINFIDNREYQLVGLQTVLEWSKDGPQQIGFYDWESGNFSELKPSEDPLLKAYLQYFINGLLNNNLSIYR